MYILYLHFILLFLILIVIYFKMFSYIPLSRLSLVENNNNALLNVNLYFCKNYHLFLILIAALKIQIVIIFKFFQNEQLSNYNENKTCIKEHVYFDIQILAITFVLSRLRTRTISIA